MTYIYNCHFFASQLWNLFSPGAVKFETTFNKSIKIKYMMEPVIRKEHMKLKLIRNYLSFKKTLRNSTKYILKVLYKISSRDERTVTGSDLRNILLLTKNEMQVDKLRPNMVNNISYKQIDESQIWRVPLVLEILDLKHGVKNLSGEWNDEELKQILTIACTQ